MKKTQIYVDARQYEALKARAAKESRSMADLIREAVTRLLEQGGDARPLDEVAGRYRPMETVDLKPHDAEWAAAVR